MLEIQVMPKRPGMSFAIVALFTSASHGASLTVLSLPATDLLASPDGQGLIAAIGPTGPDGIQNSLVEIDPRTSEPLRSVGLGYRPAQIVMSDDRSTLYVNLIEEGAIQRIDPHSFELLERIELGTAANGQAYYAQDIAVVPGFTDRFVIARKAGSVEQLALYKSGQLTYATGGASDPSDVLRFRPGTTTLYGWETNSSAERLATYAVTDNAINTKAVAFNVFTIFRPGLSIRELIIDGDQIISDSGQVVDPTTLLRHGEYAAGGAVAYDERSGRVFFITGRNRDTAVLRVFDRHTFLEVGSMSLARLDGDPSDLTRWGTNGLAFRTTNNQLFIIESDLVPASGTLAVCAGSLLWFGRRRRAVRPGRGTGALLVVLVAAPLAGADSTRIIPMKTNRLVVHPNAPMIYASTPASAGLGLGNSIATINAANASVESVNWIGSEPHSLAISDDGSSLYTAFWNSSFVRRFETATQTPAEQFAIGSSAEWGPFWAIDLAVMPGRPEVVAVARHNYSSVPGEEGIVIYDSGVARPMTVSRGSQYVDYIEFSRDGTELYGLDISSSSYPFGVFDVTDQGISRRSLTQGLFSGNQDIIYDGQWVIGTSGRVVDPTGPGLLAPFPISGAVASDSELGRVFFATRISGAVNIVVFDRLTREEIARTTLAGVSGTPRDLVRWGEDGLAFRTDTQVVLFNSTIVPAPPSAALFCSAMFLATRRRREP